MKYIILILLTIMGVQELSAQRGFKIAQVSREKTTPFSAKKTASILLSPTSKLRISAPPKVVTRGKYTYVMIQVVSVKGEIATSAFAIDRKTGFTQNFKFVCKGECSSGGACKFTYDYKGKVNGCNCCELAIKRIPVNRLTESDFGF